ncbi:unnamed protein product [marine sediment metagenome]|uniref:ParB-like N-terminal domain-containing protein n=1 Tax=marine sediment metagenome TaxID=412755 RepID=X0UY60_9ZZZZ
MGCVWVAWKAGGSPSDVSITTEQLRRAPRVKDGMKAIDKPFFIPMELIISPVYATFKNRGIYLALKENIEAYGVMIPIKVAYNKKTLNYTILDGRERWRATKNLNISFIPGQVWG